VLRVHKLNHQSASSQDPQSEPVVAKQANGESERFAETKQLAHDKSGISFVGVVKHSFSVLVHTYQTRNLDIQHQRAVHSKLQRPTHQVFFVPGQQLHSDQVPPQKYRYGPELWCQILPRYQL